MSINFSRESETFTLRTKNSLYMIKVDETGCLRHLNYGAASSACGMDYRYIKLDRGFSGNPYEFRSDRGVSFDTMPLEYSGYGAGDYRVCSLKVRNTDGSMTTDLRYKEHRIYDGKYCPDGLPHARAGRDSIATLEIGLADDHSGVRVILYYSVYEDKDLIVRSARIINSSGGDICLLKAASALLDITHGDLDLIHFHGRHCMERQPERFRIPHSIISAGSGRGISSHQHNPFVIVCDHDAGEDRGSCYGFMTVYSGNHMTEIEKDQTGSVRVTAGINESGFSWRLSPGEAFVTPEVLMIHSGSGLGALSSSFHRVIRENICDPRYIGRSRPVILNSWEACYFDFDADKILSLADGAAELGVDMLVLDDGWFGNRSSDKSGLGDWDVNEVKIGCGMAGLAGRVKAKGLGFGLWIEPEMVNEDSELYRKHPDWVLADPGRAPMTARDQWVLDMGRDEVVDYLFGSIDKLLSEADISYLKWDINRGLANVYSRALPQDRQGEASHRYMLGTYKLLSLITEAHPDVMIEGCAGGGGRFDAGILYYCPQIWCSDNTDPISRLAIQRGTSYGYPACTMSCHVSASPNHQTGRATSLNTRGVTAMSGAFGYELDPSALSDDEKTEIKKQIKDYKRYESLIMLGTYHRLGDEEFSRRHCCWSYVSEDRRECLMCMAALDVEANAPLPNVRLRGLKEDAMYRVGETDIIVSGGALMNAGFTFAMPEGNYPAQQIYIREV